ncbi:PREDICTED: transcription factor HFR1-like isoform X2 [Tarenaya hassleriana]|uniref:transcription factor HFR1-like isoform X2 n=1 Tax=Tarenaya hassleriana TaxID=28532 RepID=UPI00053C8F4D|nr:PREDICTED: transcription factor HFR1-like isoform X2 [Tarenaya hassleriana]
MFGQDFMALHDLQLSEMIKLGSNEKMAETPSDCYNYKQGGHMNEDMMTVLCEEFQTDPQIVPQLDDCTNMVFDQEVVAESLHHGSAMMAMKGLHQGHEVSMKAAEVLVPDQHSEAGGDCRRAPPRTKHDNSRRCTCTSSDESVDDEESSDGFTREVPWVTSKGSKRKRIMEARDDKKRRRAEINQKLRLLQNLIPNCDKVDKASALDMAIEYTKNLQLQLQVMSMGIRVYKPPVININACTHIPYFSPMAMSFGHCSIPVNPVAVPLITPFNSPLSPLLQQLPKQALLSPTASTSFPSLLGLVPSSFHEFYPTCNKELYDRFRFL